jgi:uncharacterized protein (TIGR00730 family)
MPTVRLSGKIISGDDPARETRAELLYQLFRSGWDIYNSNGDQKIRLDNIERKIIESNAFLFTPRPSIEDMFKVTSIFVGYQTLDKNLHGKPTILLNSDGSWDLYLSILKHLNKAGTIGQDYRDYLLEATSPDHAMKLLKFGCSREQPDPGREKVEVKGEVKTFENARPDSITKNVCVFCSATIKNQDYIDDGWKLGEKLAENNIGCVSGAGKSGIMGSVVNGNVAAGGWAAGSNVPHIIEIEGLPEGLSSFWLRDDIYTRMEVMIENSDTFAIMPGGAGTVQELLALMMFKAQGHPLMEGKSVVIFNRLMEDGGGFWEPLIKLLKKVCPDDYYKVVDNLDALVDALI